MPSSTTGPNVAGPSTAHAPADKTKNDRRTTPLKDVDRSPGDALPTSSLTQNLTAFDDTFEPPSGNSLPDSKGLTGDIQGGFSGLYNKFRASVGGMKDSDLAISIPRQDSDKPSGQLLQSKTPSLKSPRMSISDQHVAHDSNPALKFTSKAQATAKLSLPTSPVSSTIRTSQTSTTQPPTQRLQSHSRTTSAQDTVDDAHRPRGRQRGSDDHILNKASSRADEASSASTNRSTRRLQSTDIQPLTKLDTRLGHERGLSDPVSASQLGKTSHKSQNSSNNIIDKQELTKVVSHQLHHVDVPDQGVHALDFLGEADVSMNGKAPGDKVHRLQKDDSRVINSPTDSSTHLKVQKPKITHAKLPGYGASRASSTDSEFTQSTQRGQTSHLSNGGAQDDQSLDFQQRMQARRRNRLVHRDYWMKDENARDCFRCGETFTTFRRKHHCRTCGQIFDSKCTTLLSGSYFDLNSPVRVCKPCEAIITSNDDDSSDYSADEVPIPDSANRPRTPEQYSARFDDDNISIMSQNLDQMTRTPTMGLPVRRAYDKNNRSSAILTYEDHVLHRPGSSRSLHMSHGLTHGHKRHHSKHQHIRTYKAYHDDRAPFQRRTLEDLKHQKESAFHRDSVIDPELAQYLSDDASSGEEPPLHVSRSSDKLSRSGPDNDKSTISGLLAAVRKGRSRMGDRSIVGLLNLNKEADDAASIISTRAIDGNRSSRRRNLSVASSVHHRLTPKATRERLQIVLPPGHDDEAPSSPLLKGSRMMRSASMRGMSAPHLELNRASIQHVHKLLEQLLKDARVPRVSSWKDALIPILLRATDDVDPDVQNGDDIDIRNYVKLKKIPGGRPSDTAYISGLVFTKNVALKSMARTMHFPRILIITFPLEYARSEQHFMSLDPVIRQEREYLENMIGRIAALKPDILLASKNISGLALELLDKAKITAIYNVRPSILEAASRCTQTRVNHTMDKLSAAHGQLGMCDLFEIKTFVAEGRKKTYVYFSGCPPPLGCTIALRGADRRTLAIVKRITDFMIYVVYNLKLETCLMRDEWATIPGNTELTRSSVNTEPAAKGQPETIPLEDNDNIQLKVHNLETLNAEATTIGKDPISTTALPREVLEHTESNYIPDDIPVPTFYEELADKHLTKILSASPFVKFSQPYLLMRARELERRVAYLKRLRDQDLTNKPNADEKTKAQKFTLIQPEMVHSSLDGASKKVREIVHAVHDTEYDKALYLYETQKKQWEAYLSGNRNLFDPYAHQNICVLFSQISLETHVPCFGPDLLAFSYYNEHEQEQEDHFEADCTLGQYVEDLCYHANDFCTAEACGKTLFNHSRVYVHGEASIHVSMQPYPAKMKGLQDSILMWSFCKVCSTETNVIPMSSSTWKYSFGKYLELSFWSADLQARAGACPHDIHRDHIRFFGYKDIALSFQYNKINLVEVIVPRMQVTWNVDNDLRFRNDVFGKLEHRITKFMGSVKLRLKSINVDALLPDPANAEECRVEVERLANQANEDHTTLIKQLQELYMKSKHWEIIPLNRAMRSLQEKVADWDNAFSGFEQTYFPSEKDIRRLATLQLKKIFLDRDVSVTSLASADSDPTTLPESSVMSEKEVDGANNIVGRRLSLEKTQDVLQSVLEEHAAIDEGLAKDSKVVNEEESTVPQPIVDSSKLLSSDLEHLDLAVSNSVPKSPGLPATAPLDEFAKQHKHVNSSGSSEARRDADNSPIQHNEVKARADSTGNALNEPKAIPRPTTHHHSPSSTSQAIASSRSTSPKLLRAHSQPAGSLPQQKDNSQIKVLDSIASKGPSAFQSQQDRSSHETQPNTGSDVPEKSLSERFGLNTLKNSKLVKGQSFIPRSIAHRKDSRVSNLAKHFEQLSREFERERIRERRLRTSRHRQSRAYPLAAPKPVVEVYKDVYEAVDEKDTSGESLEPTEAQDNAHATSGSTVHALAETNAAHTTGKGFHTEENGLGSELTETEAEMPQSSQAPSDAELGSEDEEDKFDDMDNIVLPDSPEDLLRLSQEDVDLKELPKHERTSVMKMLSNFWAERSSSGWTTLEYPFGASDHLFLDCDIIVREDELSSIIAFTLDSTDYRSMLEKIQIHTQETVVNDKSVHAHPDEVEAEVMHSLLRKTGTHFRYSFQEGPAKMSCKIFFAEQFNAMRRKCGVDDRFVESLSRCMKFDSRGGKSRSLFLKTLDDRFVLKSLSTVETQSFLKFAPNYFQIMSEAFFHELPSVIAKMLGFYQVVIKNPVTGVEHNWFLLLMENLFYDRKPDKIFDLKGSMRNRKIEETGDSNEVLLDENMVDYIYESPLFAREHSKKLLRSSVHNDTLFLARQNVMDYSLMIAIKDDRSELVVGIIDCIRTYTWDKKLESWIKDRGFAGGGKNKPTVTSPKEYKKRFREAMSRYVLEAPSCWHQFRPVKIEARGGKAGDGERQEREIGDDVLQALT